MSNEPDDRCGCDHWRGQHVDDVCQEPGCGCVAFAEPTEMRGGLRVRAGAPVCPACSDDDAKRLDCRACGGTGLRDMEDVR